MTKVFFVRHAQPDYQREKDQARPLTEEGKYDCKKVVEFFQDQQIDVFYSSPYRRSYDTIAETARCFGKEIRTDTRFRERESGEGSNTHSMIRKRWQDKQYHEPGGESIQRVQQRNIAALREVLKENREKTIVIATHGTALSSIINYYQPSFDADSFMRIFDWMPYIIELDFEGEEFLRAIEWMHIEKEYNG